MSERERIAYEELRPGTEVQAGDQYRNTQGRWVEYSLDTSGVPIVGPTAMARRPRNITQMLAEFANQAEVLAEVRADEKRLVDDLELLRSEYVKLQDERDEARRERDLARTEVARLSTELWARKPLEDRVAALTDEVTQLRAERQEWSARFEAEVTAAALVIDELTAAKDALKSAQRARDELQLQVDELRADRRDEPTARQVQEVLRRWATELDWSADCFGSAGREQVHGVQNTLIAVMQRIESMIDAEGSRAND